MKPPDPRQHNRVAWNKMARERHRFARVAREQDFCDPLASVDGPGWLGGNIRDQRVLCLAAGGGRQGPIYAAAGAIVTVVDIADEMLELDKQIAIEKNLNIRTVHASMDDLSPIADQSFEIVIQPVSTCYIPDISANYREVARVLIPGGLYISQHKQPTSLQAGLEPNARKCFELKSKYYRDEPLPALEHANLIREPGTVEFIHRWEQIVGLMCRNGFAIEDLTEPMHADADANAGEFGHRCQYVAPYVRIKARRTDAKIIKHSLWTPDND